MPRPGPVGTETRPDMPDRLHEDGLADPPDHRLLEPAYVQRLEGRLQSRMASVVS